MTSQSLSPDRDGAPLPEEAELVTVLVPARNEDGFLGGCLESVRAQDYRNLQILVVDNGSTDGTGAVVEAHRSQDPRVELVSHPQPGIPGALNAGLARARGRWLVRVDAHSTVGPQYVRLAVERLREGSWGGVGGRKNGVGVTPAGRAIAVAMGSRFGVGGSTYHHGTVPEEVDHIAFGAYPTDLLRDLGGWDEQVPANEDFELDQRLRKTGRSLLFDPALVVSWHCRQSLPDLYRQYQRYGSGKVGVARRHPGSVRLRHALPPAAVGWFAVAVVLAARRPKWSAVMVAPYAAAVVLASARASRNLDSAREKAVLPLAFVAMHTGWGIGFWRQSVRALLARLRSGRLA